MAALLQLCLPSTFSKEEFRRSLSLLKPSSNTSLCLTYSLSVSTTSSCTIRKNTSLLLFQTPHVVAQDSSYSTTISSIEEIEPAKEEPKTRLIAQNIPWTCTTEDIRSLFAKHGTVIDVELSMYNKVRNRGLAFITMGSEEEALTALTELKSYETSGRVINVEYAKARKKKVASRRLISSTNHDVFVGNLSWKVKSKDLKDFFQSLSANVVGAEIVYQANPRKAAGYGFVSFSSMEEANRAILDFQGKVLMGNAIHLKHSKRSLKDGSKVGTQSGETSTKMNGDGGVSKEIYENLTA